MHYAEQVINLNDHRPVVKADIENGFDRLAHELTNALAENCASLSGCEYQVLFALISKTFRFHKKDDWVANIQLSEITGMSEAHISKTLRSLKAKNVIVKKGKKTGINPVVSDWKVIEVKKKPAKTKSTNKTKIVNQSVNLVEQQNLTNQFDELNQSVREVNQSVKNNQPIRPPQKKETNTKETNTKETAYAFVGKTIRLNWDDFKKCAAQYPNLSITDELNQLDLELEGQKKWWSPMHAKLNYRNRNAKTPNRTFQSHQERIREENMRVMSNWANKE